MVAEDVFVNCYNFNPISVKTKKVKKGNFHGTVPYLIKVSGVRAAVRICGSAEPEPKERSGTGSGCCM